MSPENAEAASTPEPAPSSESKPELGFVVDTSQIKENTPEAVRPTHTPEAGREGALSFNQENQGFFSNMSEKGREIAKGAYELAYAVPGVNRIVGRFEIAYNNYWAKGHEKKAAEIQGNIQGVDTKLATLGQSKQEIQDVMESLKQHGVPGMDSLTVKLKDIAQQEGELTSRKEQLQTNLQHRAERMNHHTAERSRVADKLIGHYNEMLAPMEAELGKLQGYKDRIDQLDAATTERHRLQTEKLSSVEKQKAQIEEAFRRLKMSPNEIWTHESVQTLEAYITQGRATMAAEAKDIATKKAYLTMRITEINGDADPYRNRREEFIRIKEGRPAVEKTEEKPAITAEEAPAAIVEDANKKQVPETPVQASTAETLSESSESIDTPTHISKWNEYLRAEYGNEAEELIDEADFITTTKYRLDPKAKLKPKDFMSVLKSYFMAKKKPMGRLDKIFKKRGWTTAA